MYICICNGITDKQIKEEIKAGAETLCDLQETLGIASCCGGCAETACTYLPNKSSKNIPTIPHQSPRFADSAGISFVNYS